MSTKRKKAKLSKVRGVCVCRGGRVLLGQEGQPDCEAAAWEQPLLQAEPI